MKTYKLFIGGKFPRTESGASYELRSSDGTFIANMCEGSKKDFRNAVTAAHKAATGWASATPFLRSQILYRIAEMLDGRASQFIAELTALGSKDVKAEVQASIDLLIHYAGWCDKYQSVSSTVNPVASPHFNFSTPTPVGVVAAIAPESHGLLGLVSAIAPIIAGGNVCVVLASRSQPTCAISFAEVLATSDVPGGVVNILTGNRAALLPTISSHLDVDSLLICTDDTEEKKAAQHAAADNLKRLTIQPNAPLKAQLEHILAHQETKTTWHPVG